LEAPLVLVGPAPNANGPVLPGCCDLFAVLPNEVPDEKSNEGGCEFAPKVTGPVLDPN